MVDGFEGSLMPAVVLFNYQPPTNMNLIPVVVLPNHQPLTANH